MEPGMMGWMMLLWLLFLAAIIVGIVLLVRALWGSEGRGEAAERGRRRALEILEERFARGEIDREEFEERRGAIRS